MMESDNSKELVPVAAAWSFGDVDPAPALRTAERVVQLVSAKCQGQQYIAPIAGKKYPRVEWWTTVGASLGLFPREEANVRIERTDEVIYEATVGVYRGDQLVTRASAICSSAEKRWGTADEYAIKSMATTRATGKAYRIGLSFLAVMAGLEPTSAEEVPPEGFSNRKAQAPAPAPATDDALVRILKEIAAVLDNFPPEERDVLVRAASKFTNDKGKEFVINGVADLARSTPKRIKWLGATLAKLREHASMMEQPESSDDDARF